MLSYDSIVQVRIHTQSSTMEAEAFSTDMILAPYAGTVSDADRLRLYASADDMLEDGFTASDPAYQAAKAYFSADPAPSRVYVALYGTSETPLTVLQDILDSTDDFYGVCLCEHSPGRLIPLIEGLDSLNSRIMLFVGAIGSIEDAASTDGLLRKAYDTASDRILTVYGSDIYAAAAVLGTAMGLIRTDPEGAFSLCYRQIPGMLPVNLTESELLRLRILRCNTYVTRGKSRKLLEQGTMVSGRRFHEAYALDRISADLQEAAISLLTDSPGRLPQTDATSAVFINRFSAVLAGYAAAGALATGIWRGDDTGSLTHGSVIENGYLLWADSYDTQSDADRAAHKAMPIHVALCPAGSVETLVIEVDVSI